MVVTGGTGDIGYYTAAGLTRTGAPGVMDP